MSDGVEYTDEDYNIAYNGLKTQFKGVIKGHSMSYWNDTEFQYFIKQTAEAIAYREALIRLLQNTMHGQWFPTEETLNDMVKHCDKEMNKLIESGETGEWKEV